MNIQSFAYRLISRAPGSVVLLLTLAACEPFNHVGEAATGAANDWQIVDAYVALDRAWHARDEQIMWMDASDNEKDRLREETRGEHPDITLAAVAATRIIESGQPRVREAAEFLVEQTWSLPTAEKYVTLGMATLANELGPDWTLVEAYHEDIAAWTEAMQTIREAEVSDREKRDLREQLGERPKTTRAIAAAMAVVSAGADHPHLLEAAEFLIGKGAHEPGANSHVLMAANALAAYFPHYDDWPLMLGQIAAMFTPSDEVSGLVRTLAEQAEDPLVRATARYHAAAMLIPKINAGTMTPDEREALRKQAIQLATGMSSGIEEAEFVSLASSHTTFSEREAELLATIQTVTVGVRVPNIGGKRLDGSRQDLSDFAGQVVLVDFWATWCGPCVDALPKLRELVQDLPADRFEILSISVDDEVETVTDFQLDEPMPWSNWHADIDGHLVNSWQVRAFPTYVLLDTDGLILARDGHLGDELESLIRQAVFLTSEEGVKIENGNADASERAVSATPLLSPQGGASR